MPEGWRMFGMLAMCSFDLAMSALGDLMIRDHTKRCLAVLLRLGDCRDPNLTEKGPIELDLSQGDIATMANLSRNAVGTVLRGLEARGVISLEYRIVKILDAEALRKAASA
jgi:CRP/FNR family cyclic AMP-dependent transcriptional regulator